jgi:hypothetical protein
MIKKLSLQMIRISLIISLMIVNCFHLIGQSAKDKDGFIKIFNGKTLAGWEGDPTYWRVEDGNLVGEITPSTLLKTNSFVIWQGGSPADFEIKLEFKITKSGNSGINYRSSLLSEVPYALKGYQADIDGANRYTGQNYEERARTTLAYIGERVSVDVLANSNDALKDHIKNNAWLVRTVNGSLGKADELVNTIQSDNWNTCHIIAKGNRLLHYMNNVLMSDVTDNDPVNRKSAGLIGVQVHVGPPMKVEYRNIRLKEIK